MSEFKVGDKVRFKSGTPAGEFKVTLATTTFFAGPITTYQVTDKETLSAKIDAFDNELIYVGSPTDWIEAFRNAKPEELREIAELLWPIMMTLPINWPKPMSAAESIKIAALSEKHYCLDPMLANKCPDVGKPIVSIISPGREV